MTAIVDTNVLLYATDRDSSFHARSNDWLVATLAGAGSVGFSWVAMLGFARIATNPRIMRSPATSDEAFDVIDDWLSQPGAVIVHPTPSHASIVRQLLRSAGTAANLVNDAHIAALALEHHASVCSFDSDFERFEGVRRFEPFASPAPTIESNP